MSTATVRNAKNSKRMSFRRTRNDEMRRILRLLKNAQFDIGRKTDVAKLIRRERT